MKFISSFFSYSFHILFVNKYLLLAEFSVCTVNYGSSFFSIDLWPKREAQRAYHARIASELRFRFGHKSFYGFGIRSFLATSHKQILKTSFNMTSSCILGFKATRAETWAHFIHPLCLLYVGKSQNISEANTTVPDWTGGWKSLPWKV